jgi:hypothetical protein
LPPSPSSSHFGASVVFCVAADFLTQAIPSNSQNFQNPNLKINSSPVQGKSFHPFSDTRHLSSAIIQSFLCLNKAFTVLRAIESTEHQALLIRNLVTTTRARLTLIPSQIRSSPPIVRCSRDFWSLFWDTFLKRTT